jgi:hypothetical protein
MAFKWRSLWYRPYFYSTTILNHSTLTCLQDIDVQYISWFSSKKLLNKSAYLAVQLKYPIVYKDKTLLHYELGEPAASTVESTDFDKMIDYIACKYNGITAQNVKQITDGHFSRHSSPECPKYTAQLKEYIRKYQTHALQNMGYEDPDEAVSIL